MIIDNSEGLLHLENGNRFLGTPPKLIDSTIEFIGSDNILYCEPGVVLNHSLVRFHGDRGVVVLGENRFEYKIWIPLFSDCVCFFGRNNYMNGTLNIVLSERKHFFAGRDGLYSIGFWARNSDPHLIYSIKTKRRLNPSKSIFIGDHVWIGQSAMLLKGAKIDSGSIVGAKALVSGKHIPHNTVWAGNPARQIASDIFWDTTSVNRWTSEMTEACETYDGLLKRYPEKKPDEAIFRYERDACISFEAMDDLFDRGTADEKVAYLKKLLTDEAKNRFVHTK